MHLKQEYLNPSKKKNKKNISNKLSLSFDYEIELNITFDCEILKISISKIMLIVIVGYKK